MENNNQFNNAVQKLATLKKNIHNLRKLYDSINDKIVQEEFKKIIKTSDKIYKEVLENTDKIYKVEKFTTYYLVTVEKVISKYIKFKSVNYTTQESVNFFNSIENFLKNINLSFTNLYNSLFTEELIDIDAEIKVFEKEMKI